jgi:Holliday junction DNA helicase RuvB
MIGQDEARAEVEKLVLAARGRGLMPRHTALIGPGGCGKTAVARTFATLLDASFAEVLAGAVSSPGDMTEWLMSLGEYTIGFIDEFHEVKRPAREQVLYSALSDGFVMVKGKEGPKPHRLAPFTLVVATTEGKFNPSMARRFKCITLSYYSVEDLTKIIVWTATEHHTVTGEPFQIELDAAHYLAVRSLGVAGVAQQRLEDAIDQAASDGEYGTSVITLAHVVEAMRLARIDDIGLNLRERTILIAVAGEAGRPIGIKSIGDLTGMSDISEQVATLTRLGLLRQNDGQRGRIVPAWVYEDILDMDVPPMVAGREAGAPIKRPV